jgi:hypothetical protein
LPSPTSTILLCLSLSFPSPQSMNKVDGCNKSPEYYLCGTHMIAGGLLSGHERAHFAIGLPDLTLSPEHEVYNPAEVYQRTKNERTTRSATVPCTSGCNDRSSERYKFDNNG